MEPGFVPLIIMMTLYIASKVRPKSKADKEIRKMFKLDEASDTGDVVFKDVSAYRESMILTFRAYMNSVEWAWVRIQVIERDEKCMGCPDEGYVVHHTKYRNWGKGDMDEVHDCMYLCSACHDYQHKMNFVVVPFFAKRKESGYVSSDMGSVSHRSSASVEPEVRRRL